MDCFTLMLENPAKGKIALGVIMDEGLAHTIAAAITKMVQETVPESVCRVGLGRAEVWCNCQACRSGADDGTMHS